MYNTEKGYAFVTMVDEDAAQAAMRGLNGEIIDGQVDSNLPKYPPK